ncbi:S1C family serine protease [Paenibacillus qinlingensis]|uniref:S1-C subfamily serine protease n=1 Tax=Paenibacillus qinlingensis TaxID=1837343 RepID=A0ABU1NZY6_9BACL|nr:S1C family serine protease [Paenibacillus qinlingensis]MDR6552572.1 S1-C subfamily serine protease [Paenibacillus qinlingensis]
MGNWTVRLKKGGITLVAAFVLMTTFAGPQSWHVYAAEINADIPQVIEKASPSVVAIIGKPSSEVDKTLEKNRFNLAHGTGVIVASNGVIVTNAHVVKDMKNIVVVTSEGTTYRGHASNIDEESDLALVKIDAVGLQPATFASSSDIKVGETVAAIGTPISFALRNSVTVGIVSGLDRSVSSQYQLIQTDAAINPGNSGGALINMKGEVIGINTMKYADIGIENLGFAIPVDTVKYVLKHFELYGKVKRAYTGLELEESWEAVVGLPSMAGLRVDYVDADSPAAEAGIEQDEVVVSIGSDSVQTLVDYNEAIKKYLPGQTVDIKLQSGSATLTKSVKLGELHNTEATLTEDADGSSLDADSGKTKIGDSHFGWSMKYPAGLVKRQQSDDGDSISFVDAKGEFALSIRIASDQSDELSPAALLTTIAGEDDSDYSSYGNSATVLERQYVKRAEYPYAKVVSRSGEDGYIQTRGYLHGGRLYTVQLFVTKEQYTNRSKQNSYNDLLDSFKLAFNTGDNSLKDISVFNSDDVTYTSEYGLSIDLPAAWEQDYHGSTSFYNDEYSQSLEIHVTSASSGDTLQNWVDREVDMFEAQYTADYRRVDKPVEATVDGVPAWQVDFASSLGDEWFAGRSLFFIKDKYKYEVRMTYPKDEQDDELEKMWDNVVASITVDKETMDGELGFIQDLNELADPDRTALYKNEKFNYTLRIPENWTTNRSYDGNDQATKSFSFPGGYLRVEADNKSVYTEVVKDAEEELKKSHTSDSDYSYSAEDVTLFGDVKAKKYKVSYSKAHIPYTETIYLFNRKQVTYTVTLRTDVAVSTAANVARLNKAFDSFAFVNGTESGK